jgi:quercetin dioxygenase-like cupin family protein
LLVERVVPDSYHRTATFTEEDAMKKWMSLAGALALACVGCVVAVWASPATGVTPSLLARGTYGAFKAESDWGGVNFEGKAKTPIDLVVRQHTYDPGGSTGWHQHPGPVFITVKTGTLTFYEVDDPTCTPHEVGAGQGYVDSGHGHIARNETSATAVDVSVIVAPVNGAFRIDPPDFRNPACPF